MSKRVSRRAQLSGRRQFPARPIILTAAYACCAPALAQSPAEVRGAGQVEEVIVTATRRETTLREAPTAVSSFSDDLLEQRQIDSLANLNGLVPGLQFGASYSDTRITLRGIGTNNVSGGADPGVSFHLDGVYIGTTGPAANAFYDIERVEILRGPQGTLFGRNATGGSVNVIPHRPTPEFSGSAAATVGVDPLQYSLEGVLNGPLTDSGTVAGRLSVQRNFNDGYTRNLAASGPDRLDDDDSYAARAQLLFQPGEAFTGHFTAEYRRQDSNGTGYQLIGGPGFGPTPAELLGGVRPDPRSHDVFATPDYNQGKFFLASFATSTEFDSGTLRTLVSAGDMSAHFAADGDGTEVDFTASIIDLDARQYFGEVLYETASSERWVLIAGANVFYQHLQQRFTVPLLGLPVPVVLDGDRMLTNSYAAFLHLDYHLTERLDLFGGVRYTFDRKALRESNNFIGALSQEHDWDRYTYEIGVAYELSDSVNAYAKYATGFKSGGFQIGNIEPPVDPETNASVEVGIKGLFFDASLEANLAAFHMTYDDLQVQQVTGFSSGFKNAAEAHSNGVEAEVTWLPTAALRLELVGAWLDAQFDEFLSIDPANPALGVQDLSGNRLRSAPELSYSAAAYYTAPVRSAGELIFGGRYYWQDEVFFSEFNLPVASQKAVARVDLDIDYVASDGKWRAGLYARNVTDEVVRNSATVVSALLGSPSLATLDPGRTIGVSFRRDF